MTRSNRNLTASPLAAFFAAWLAFLASAALAQQPAADSDADRQQQAAEGLERLRESVLKPMRDRVEEPESTYKFNTGVSDYTSKVATWLEGTQPFGKGALGELWDSVRTTNMDNYKKFAESNAEDAVRRMENSVANQQKRVDDLAARRRQLDDSARQHQQRGDELRRQRDRLAHQASERGASGIKSVERRLETLAEQRRQAVAKGDAFRQQLAELKAEEAKTELLARKRQLARSQRELASLQRAEKIGNGLWYANVLMSAYDACEYEANRARAEGRQISKTGQTVRFLKNVSGITAVSSLKDSVELAHLERLVEKLEEYNEMGLDLEDSHVWDRAAGFARRAAIREGIYGGSELMPVVGDLLSVKEGADAWHDMRAEAAVTLATTTDNENRGRLMAFDAVLRLEGHADRVNENAQRTRAAIDVLRRLDERLRGSLDAAREAREAVARAAMAAERQQEALDAARNAPAAELLTPSAVAGLGELVAKVTQAAKEHLVAIRRARGEHQAGKLTDEGVATNHRFIADLMGNTLIDYRDALGKEAQLQALGCNAQPNQDLPQLVEQAEAAKKRIDQLAGGGQELLDAYVRQADALRRMLSEFDESKQVVLRSYSELDRTLDSMDARLSARLDAARARAMGVPLERREADRLIENAAGLAHTAAELRALDRFTRLPAAPDLAAAHALGRQAADALKRLEGPIAAMKTAVEQAQAELDQLAALGKPRTQLQMDDLNAIVRRAPPPPDADLLNLRPRELAARMQNFSTEGPNRVFLSDDFHGFTAHSGQSPDFDFDKPAQLFVPGGHHKIVEQGTTRVWYDKNQNGKQDPDEPWREEPYWIAYNATVTATYNGWSLDRKTGYCHNSLVGLQASLKPSQTEHGGSRWDASSITLAPADQAYGGIQTYTSRTPDGAEHHTESARAGALYGPFHVWLNVSVRAQCGWLPADSTTPEYTPAKYIANWEEIDRRVAFYKTGRETVARQLLENMLQPARPYVEFSRARFHMAAEHLLPKPLSGFAPRGGSQDDRDWLALDSWTSFEKREKLPEGPSWARVESYSVHVWACLPDVVGTHSWQDALDQADKRGGTMPQNGTAFSVNIPESRAMRALRWAKEPLRPKGRNAAGPVYYSMQERISFSLDNCHAYVDGNGSNLGGPNLRTAELAQQVADIIRQARGGKQ